MSVTRNSLIGTKKNRAAGNRIVLITGGSRGLGRAAALALAASGEDIILTYHRNESAAAAVVAEVEARGRRAVAMQLDTTAMSTFAAFAETLGAQLREEWDRNSFDVLINNAGHSGSTPFGAIEEDEINRLVAVHFTGVVLLTQELAPLLNDGGRILNISTGLVRIPVNPAMSVYASLKAAIETWTLYLARQLGERNVAVNVLAPGATATDFGGGNVRDDEATRARLVSTIAMGRVAEPDDIGNAIAGVLDPRMEWVTGQRIEASGGQRL